MDERIPLEITKEKLQKTLEITKEKLQNEHD